MTLARELGDPIPAEPPWRHLDFFQHQAFLHARVARIDCPNCGVRLVDVSWARPGSGFTLLFEAFAMTLVTAMPVAAAARLVGEHDTRLWRVVLHHVEKPVTRMDLADLRRVAIDETAATRGHNYITLFVDIDTRKVVYVAGSPYARSSVGIARGWMSRSSYRRCQPISATPVCGTHIGTSRLSRTAARGGAAPRSAVGGQTMKSSCNVATLIERYFTDRLMRQRNVSVNTVASYSCSQPRRACASPR